MMADTVKKSRIVSDDDDNLEEAMLEEFNARLKNCMSKDDLKTADEQQHHEEDDAFYEQICDNNPRPIPRCGTASNDFLLNERQHAYYDPVSLSTDSTQRRTTEEEENIYETLPEYGAIEKTEPTDQFVEESASESVEPNLNLDLSPKAAIDDDDNVEETVDSSYEVVKHQSTDRPVSFTMETTDFSEQRSPEDNARSVRDRMFLATDDAATLLFTQTVTSPMLTPSEENIDFLRGFQRENTNSDATASNDSPPKEDVTKTSNDNSTSDISVEISASEPLANEMPEGAKTKEEIIYENAEFLKRQAENIYQNTAEEGPVYENLMDVKRKVEDLEEHEEHIYQDIDEYVKEGDLQEQDDPAKEDDVYESVGEVEEHQEMPEEQVVDNSFYSNESSVPDLVPIESDPDQTRDIAAAGVIEFENYETLEVDSSATFSDQSDKIEKRSETVEKRSETVEKRSEIVEKRSETVEKPSETVKKRSERVTSETGNVETVESNTEDSLESKTKETYSEFIYHSKTESNYYEKYNEVVSKTSANPDISNREKDTETVPAEIVKNLKSQFSRGGAEVVAITKKDEAELKTVNIMEHISKFENLDSRDGINPDDSTVTETYTETTTIQSDVPEEKSLKKKKIKKSRKEEKENISVNDFDVVNGENVYNVNVKSLCRSFGDLTKIADDKDFDRQVRNSGRTKSLSDVLLSSNKKNIENVFSEVSVRTLKEKFNIVENKKPLGILKLPFKNSQLKSSFSKFDALQKKNVLHIRSSDSTKAQDKFTGAQSIDTTNCKSCSKQVFQMEQIKAEKAIWHKNCFRCTECSKQLTVETYVSHEGNLYCKPHFKSLFAPKVVEDETPPSDKPDLGLEELQSLNVKERFRVFEQHQSEYQDTDRGAVEIPVKRSPSILSKLAKFQSKGMDIGVTDDALNSVPIELSSSEGEEDDEVPEGEDPTLYRARKVQKEKPFHFTNLHEVKNKWEHGQTNVRNEKREETKQEIMTLRNKIFMGKQGKMKEAYEKAVELSETSPNTSKSEKIESCDTKSLKERFERGETFERRETKNEDEEETEVFQSEISKNSRSLFLELDANAKKAPQMSPVTVSKLDVKKARETDTPEREIYHDPEVVRSEDNKDDSEIAKTMHTASKMLNKFRQMEEDLTREPEHLGPRALKTITPPPSGSSRSVPDSEEASEAEEETDDEDQTDNQKLPEDLLEAKNAAKAKEYRAKFESWTEQESRREQSQTVNIVEEYGEESQIESTKSLRARFESMGDSSSDNPKTQRMKVNRFVEIPSITELCESCDGKVYPLEKISVHGHVYHRNCFKCMECSCVLRMDSFSYNQGLLYCTPHFKRLFISKGNYDTAFGLGQHKEKWNINATMA